jgi:plasmid stabilization system protein ParE
VRLVLRPRVHTDLKAIFDWISKDDPSAARAMIARLLDRIDQLLIPGFARMGRPSSRRGVRELVEPPDVILYRVDDDREEVSVFAVFHGARRR